MAFLSGQRRILILSALFGAAAFLLPIAYHVWGVSLIADAYYQRSWSIFSFLNRIFEAQQGLSLEFYYAKAEGHIYRITAGLFVLSLVPYLFALETLSQTASGAMVTRQIDRVIFAIGLLFSMTMVFLLDDTYMKADVRSFFVWQSFLNHSMRDIYTECHPCNYPILGVLFSAGILDTLKSVPLTLEWETYVQLFRYVLALVDGANVVLIYLILRALSIPRSLFWAGFAGILPSSWVGGALWGQIDGFSQFFLLLFLLYTAAFWVAYDNADPGKKRTLVYVIGSSVILACFLLTKQLALFSFPVLVFMAFVTLYLRSREDYVSLWCTLMALVVMGILLPDLFLNLDEGYFSHLQYVLFGGGSPHGNKISGNGFNIWMVLGWGMASSSEQPFFSFLTPKNTGVFLFLSYELFLFGSALLWLKSSLKSNHAAVAYQEMFLVILFILALTNLAFNVLLSGTHERYLYHFYPFLLIAYLGLRQTSAAFSGNLLDVIWIGAVLYGAYVYAILDHAAFPIYAIYQVLAALHLGLLCYLTLVYVRHQRLGTFRLKSQHIIQTHSVDQWNN